MRSKRSVRKEASGGGAEARSAASRGRVVVVEVAFEVEVMAGAEVRSVANRGVDGVAVGGVGRTAGCAGAAAAAAAQLL